MNPAQGGTLPLETPRPRSYVVVERRIEKLLIFLREVDPLCIILISPSYHILTLLMM